MVFSSSTGHREPAMFFYAAKIVWALLQPSGLLLLAIGAALWSLSRGRLAVARTMASIALGLALAGLSPIPNLLLLPLELRFARADLTAGPVTGLIILGGGEDGEIAAYWHTHALNEGGERITEGVALSRTLPQARVVFSGGTGLLVPGAGSEGAATRDMLISMGVAPERLLIEDRSRDTWENAVYSKALVLPRPGERWLLITSGWHMPRAMGVFRRAGFAVEPWPVDYRTSGWRSVFWPAASPADGLRRLEVVTKEYVGLATYWLKGRSSALFPAPCAGALTCK
jgi:uncharacterized SAM-binding protein YcdF (DUF218 family)